MEGRRQRFTCTHSHSGFTNKRAQRAGHWHSEDVRYDALPNSDKNNTSTASHSNFRGLHISIFNQHISDNDKTCLLRLQLYIRIVEALRLFIWRAINLSKDSCAYFIAILLAIYDSINWDLCTNFIPARVHMCCLTRKFLKSLNPIDFCFLWLGEREQTMETTCSSTDTSKILKKISARLNLKKKKKEILWSGPVQREPILAQLTTNSTFRLFYSLSWKLLADVGEQFRIKVPGVDSSGVWGEMARGGEVERGGCMCVYGGGLGGTTGRSVTLRGSGRLMLVAH